MRSIWELIETNDERAKEMSEARSEKLAKWDATITEAKKKKESKDN